MQVQAWRAPVRSRPLCGQKLPCRAWRRVSLRAPAQRRAAVGSSGGGDGFDRQPLDSSSGSGRRLPPLPPPPPGAGLQLLAASTVAYAGMTALGVLGAGRERIGDMLQGDWHLGAALLWTAALVPYPLVSCYLADRVPAFGEIRALFKATIVPTLEQLPAWGIALLALGAGVGEETLFRGFLQTAAVDGLASWGPEAGGGLPPDAATALGVAAVSLLFGALHAITPLYFYFATAGGALFGIEFLTAGLPAAAATHSLYDFVALMYIVREWGSSSSGAKG